MLHRHILAHEPKDPPTNNPHISDQPFLPKTASDSVQRTEGTFPSSEAFLDQKSSDHKRTGYWWEGPKSSARPNKEDLGKMLINIYESGYLDRTQAYKMSFLKGVLGGLGGVIGATIVLGLIVWILALFDDVPLVGRLIENIRNTVNSPRP